MTVVAPGAIERLTIFADCSTEAANGRAVISESVTFQFHIAARNAHGVLIDTVHGHGQFAG
jgi:hypothetical protein